MRRAILLALLAGSSLPSTSAGVIVIDAANGPGAQFTDLGAAIAAATDGDVLLLRSGTYAGAHQTTKAVSFVAADGAIVMLQAVSGAPSASTSVLHLLPAAAGDVVVRGIAASTATGGHSGFGWSPSSTGGQGHFEECRVPIGSLAGIYGAGARPLVLARCEGRGGDGTGEFPSIAHSGLDVGCPIACFGGSFRGGDGSDAAIGTPFPVAGDGAAAIMSISFPGKLQVFVGVHVDGGAGGDGAFLGACVAEGAGGDGILSLLGSFTAVGVKGGGGSAGSPSTGCSPLATEGDLHGTSFLGQAPILLPGHPAEARLPRVRASGAPADLEITGPAGVETWIVLGATPAFATFAGVSGVLAVSPQAVASLGPLPPAGALTVGGRAPAVPQGMSHAFLYTQVITRDGSGQIVIGAPSAMLVLP